MRRFVVVCAVIGLFSWAVTGVIVYRSQGLAVFPGEQFAAAYSAFNGFDDPFLEPWNSSQPFAGFGSIIASLLGGPQSLWSTPVVVDTKHPLFPVPACVINAEPASIPYGGTTVLSWASRSATAAQLEGIGPVTTTGSFTLSNVIDTQALSLTVSGPGGYDNCFAILTVGAHVVASLAK